MPDDAGRWITYNGEIYNYPELRLELGGQLPHRCDTEVVLRAYERWGPDCSTTCAACSPSRCGTSVEQELLCARDRFGIKPLYYAQVGDVLYFASEAKALLPFLPRIETDLEGLKDYLTFQFCLAGKTLFKGVRELLPGHRLRVRNGAVVTERYWEVYYDLDFDHTASTSRSASRSCCTTPCGCTCAPTCPSGPTSAAAWTPERRLAGQPRADEPDAGVHRPLPGGRALRREPLRAALADERGLDLHVVDIGAGDFLSTIGKVIYHLDYPVAGPGSFPQYMVSEAAARDAKVILGGQGGDEIFGGYTRYLIAYFEQCIKAAIDGTSHNGNFVVTYESIIPNLARCRTTSRCCRSSGATACSRTSTRATSG